MILREYQASAINRSLEALSKYNNTLLVAPTGAGKTVILSSLISEFVKRSEGPLKVLVLQHRKEIINQNLIKFKAIDGSVPVTLITQEHKDDSGVVVFAMIQTLHRNPGLIKHYDLIVIDEAHHAVAHSYMNIIVSIKAINPQVNIFGVTATPLRGDGKRLGNIFDNISFSIEINDLISTGVLVKPRPYVIDIGLREEIEKRTNGNADVSDMEMDFLSSEIIQSSVIDMRKAFDCWYELARNRKTVIFTPKNVDSVYISNIFSENGVACGVVTHDTSKQEREIILNKFKNGNISVIFNTNILTEGWDCPETSCVVLFKTSSYKSTYIQMIGRGLRSHPNKEDCVIIDFGCSTVRHGTLEQSIYKSLEDQRQEESSSTESSQEVCYYKNCSRCNAEIPMEQKICFICGFEYGSEEEKQRLIEEFKLKEFNLIQEVIKKSNYLFVPVEDNQQSFLTVVSHRGYIGIFYADEQWRVIGNISSDNYTKLYHSSNSKAECFEVAYKILRGSKGKEAFLKKNNEWLNRPPSDKQIACINLHSSKNFDFQSMNRFEATCLLSFLFNKKDIRKVVNG